MNLPNALTLVRMFLVPILVVVLLTEFEGPRIVGVSKELLGAGIFALASPIGSTATSRVGAGRSRGSAR
jgi:phosphatidylglycerophosphate synthase